MHDSLAATGLFSAMPHEGQEYTRAIAIAERRGFERVWTEYLDDLRMTEADGFSCVPRLLHDWHYTLTPPLKPIVLEKTTANAARMRWLQAWCPSCSFIGMVRNGFAVTEGIMRKGHKDAKRGAKHWNAVNTLMLDDSKQVRRFLPLSYEDLVDAPSESLERIGEFLGLGAGVLSDAVDTSSFKNMNEWSLNRLDKDQMRLIDREAEPMLRLYGYSC